MFNDVRLSPRNNTPSPQYISPHIEPPTIKVSAPKNDDTKTPVSEQQGPTVTIPIATLAEWSKKMNEATQNINSPSGTRPSPTSTTTRPGLATSYPADPEDDGGRAKSEGGGNGNPDQTAKTTTGKGVSIQILNKMIVEEILEDIISDFNNFNYDKYCFICNSSNELCQAPVYCSKIIDISNSDKKSKTKTKNNNNILKHYFRSKEEKIIKPIIRPGR